MWGLPVPSALRIGRKRLGYRFVRSVLQLVDDNLYDDILAKRSQSNPIPLPYASIATASSAFHRSGNTYCHQHSTQRTR